MKNIALLGEVMYSFFLFYILLMGKNHSQAQAIGNYKHKQLETTMTSNWKLQAHTLWYAMHIPQKIIILFF